MIVFMVDLTERYVYLFGIFILYIYQHVDSELIDKNQINHRNTKLEKRNNEKDISNIYTSSKANEFLTYDKCMQRMKCPVNRKEECSEECKAGNTEEEIEEHKELTMSEHRKSTNKRPKSKFDTDKQLNKNKQQKLNQTIVKTDL